MAKYRLCCDPGYVDDLALALVRIEDNHFIWGGAFDMTDGKGLTRAKNGHVKKRKFREGVLSTLDFALETARSQLPADIWYGSIEFVCEAQISDRANGRDLVWLEGAITALAFARGWMIRDPIRNMDACKKLGIPVARKEISRSNKKKKTLEVVNREMGLSLDNDHLADALLLHLSCCR